MKTPKRIGSTLSHDRAPKQEKGLTKRLGGSLVPRSGAGPVKGDVRVRGIMRLEAKTTGKKSFPITHHLVDQIEEAAVSTGEIPAVQVQFIDARGTVTRSVCVVPDWVLEELVAYGAAQKRQLAGDGPVPEPAEPEPAPLTVCIPDTPAVRAIFDATPRFASGGPPDAAWDDAAGAEPHPGSGPRQPAGLKIPKAKKPAR